jgi:hypothetical protein
MENSTLWIAAIILFAFLSLGIVRWKYHSGAQIEGFDNVLTLTPGKFSCDIDQRKSQSGLSWFRSQRLIICALLRDSESTIHLIQRQAEAVGKLFSDYTILIVENDSHDNTRLKLLEWAKRNRKVRVLGCDGINLSSCSMNLNPTIIHDRTSGRIDKMVRLRNIYLDHIRSDPKLASAQIALIWDMDIHGAFYLDGLGSTGYYFKNGIDNRQVDAICANGVADVGDRIESGKYYDPYAHEDIGQTRTFTTVDDINPPACNLPPIHVRSCFNGFMFYRLPALLAKRYALEKSGAKEAICEHVGVHRGMNIYLNPGMVYLMQYHDDDPWGVGL